MCVCVSILWCIDVHASSSYMNRRLPCACKYVRALVSGSVCAFPGVHACMFQLRTLVVKEHQLSSPSNTHRVITQHSIFQGRFTCEANGFNRVILLIYSSTYFSFLFLIYIYIFFFKVPRIPTLFAIFLTLMHPRNMLLLLPFLS